MVDRLILVFALTLTAAAAAPTPHPAPLDIAQTLAHGTPTAGLRDELLQDVATALARRGRTPEALALAAPLPPFRHATVLLTIAESLPTSQRKEAEKLLLEAQTDRALTVDWHKSRIARLLAVTHAKLGHFEIAESIAREVPDAEDRAFALRDVVSELSRNGDVARARELAAGIEENRRYGTYRQKAGALADVARTLHARGDPEGAATLLAQAELLLPKKPGWSDGPAMIEVGVAEHACGQTEQARALLLRAEALAQAITGAWKVSELVNLAAAWRACGDTERADARLTDAEKFLASLPPLERAPEAITLARAQAGAKATDSARALLGATLAGADGFEQSEAWRAVRVRTTLAWVELFGDAPLPTKESGGS